MWRTCLAASRSPWALRLRSKATTSQSAWLRECIAITRERLRQLFVPHLDDEALRAALSRLRQGLPPPVIWLFGKVQAGKTSIIRALTGAERAQIGSGFAPCTRWAARYEDRKSTRLNSSHDQISYAVFCLKKKKKRGLRANSPEPKPIDRLCEQIVLYTQF